jgi:hypothetical protein
LRYIQLSGNCQRRMLRILRMLHPTDA